MSLAIQSPPPWVAGQPGVYLSVPEDDYHASGGWSVSRLKRVLENPARSKLGMKETATLRFGTLIHDVLLQGEEAVRPRYLVSLLETFNERHKAYQEEKRRAEAEGLTLVKQKDFEAALRIRDAVMKQAVGRDVLAGIKPDWVEQSFYWIDWETGLLCRGRTDLCRRDMGVLIDLKSCEDATQDGFEDSIARYGYDLQDVYYQEGYEQALAQSLGPEQAWRPDEFWFLAIEKEPPHFCNLIHIKPEQKEASRVEVRETLRLCRDFEDAGFFPGYSDTLLTAEVRDWARRERARNLERQRQALADHLRFRETPA